MPRLHIAFKWQIVCLIVIIIIVPKMFAEMSLWRLGGWSCKWNITSSSCWSQEVKILFLDLCFWWKMLVECVYQYHPWYCVQGLTSNLVFKLTRHCRKLINIQICCIYSICDARYFHSQFSDIDRREGPFIKL